MYNLSSKSVYIQESDFVWVQIFVYDEKSNLVANKVRGGNISLNYKNSMSYYADFDGKLATSDNIISVYFIHPANIYDLDININVFMDNGEGLAFNQKVEFIEKNCNLPLQSNIQSYINNENANKPGYAPSEYLALETNIQDHPWDKTIIKDDSIILNLDFMKKDDYTNDLTDKDSLIYVGGENRFLKGFAGDLVYQDLDVLPNTISAYNTFEKSSENLITNADFLLTEKDIPVGFNLNWEIEVYNNQPVKYRPYFVKSITKKNSNGREYNQFNLRASGVENYYGKNRAILSTDKIIINSSNEYVTFSILVKAEPTDTTRTKNCYSYIEFLDNADNVISTISGTIYNIKDLTDKFHCVFVTAEIPNNAEKVICYLSSDSYYDGDDITWRIILPQLEYNKHPTSRMLGIRQSDILTNEVSDLTKNEGEIDIEFNLPKELVNITDEKLVLFDLREDDQNGYWSYILNSSIVFEIVSNGNIFDVSGRYLTDLELVKDKNHKIRILWKDSLIKIIFDDVLIGEHNTPFEFPDNISSNIYIGSDYSGEQFLNGRIEKFFVKNKFFDS